MKKILAIFLLLVIPLAFVMASGGQEPLKILTAGMDPLFKQAEAVVLEVYPDTEFEYILVDMTTGSTMTMDTMIASGDRPDIYSDAVVRLSRYVTPAFAMPLPASVTDGFVDLSAFTRNGEVLGVPRTGAAQGMCVNLDMLEEVGYVMPDNWTLDDFYEMAEMVKAYSASSGKEYYATGIFAGNQSGDYLWMNWFATFGVDLYTKDYGASAQRKDGAAVWAFFGELQSKGYVAPNSAPKVDDDYVVDWASGKLAVAPFFEGWNTHYFKTMIDQGVIEEAHNYKFVKFPNNAKPVSSIHGILVSKDTEYADEAALFVKAMTTTEIIAKQVVESGQIPFKPVSVEISDPRLQEMLEIAADGLYDLGHSMPWFSEVRAQGFPVLQRVLSGELTGAEAAEAYADAVDSIIK